MASYEQVLKLENEKPDGVIRLVESSGFYRAYNKSAFLFHKVIAQHKVTRKFAKNINQEIVYVGFPVDRLLERVGGRSHKKTDFGYDVELAAGELPDMEGYEEWRKTVPTEPASRGEVAALPRGGEELRRAVCERIATWGNLAGFRRTGSGSIRTHWIGLATLHRQSSGDEVDFEV